MSLILKGSPSGTVYAQASDVDVSSSTDISVYISVIPSDNVSAPFVIASDSPLDGAPRGFYLRQDSPTLMTLGWTTANGSNEHQFTVASATEYHLVSHFDITAGEVIHYVDSTTPAVTHSSVGAAIDSSTFNVRLTTSSVAGEEAIVGDLAVWNNGVPDTTALADIYAGNYLGRSFNASGCDDKYILVGSGGVFAPSEFVNMYNQSNRLVLERDSAGGDAKCDTGNFLPAVDSDISTQVSAPDVDVSDKSGMYLNRIKFSQVITEIVEGVVNYRTPLEELTDYYDKDTGVWTSVPVTHPSMGSSDFPVMFTINGSYDSEANDGIVNGPFVLEWDGNGVLSPTLGVLNRVDVGPNRIEFDFAGRIAIESIPDGGSVSNIRCYRKDYESIFAAGRMYLPKMLEYVGRYDCIRMGDSMDIEINKSLSWDDAPTFNDTTWHLESPIEAQLLLGMEADTTVWLNIPPMIGCTEALPVGGSTEYTDLGERQAPLLDQVVIDTYFDNIVAAMDSVGWPTSKELKIEVGTELWSFTGANLATYYARGIGNYYNANGFGDYGSYSGYGHLSTLFMASFERALNAAGRSGQVWTPILSTSDTNDGILTSILVGAAGYISMESSSFDITKYVVSISGDASAPFAYASDNDVLGQTYGASADFYTAMAVATAADKESVLESLYKAHIGTLEQNRLAINSIKTAMSAYGITSPIQEYSSTPDSSSASNRWRDDPDLSVLHSDYNNGGYSGAIQIINNELFILNNPNGGVACRTTVGTYDSKRPTYLAPSWDEIDTSNLGIAWDNYLDPIPNLTTIWTNYQASLSVDEEFITIDEANIRATHLVLPMTTAAVVRSTGSIFSSANFDSINFEGAEFFYTAINGGVTYTPELDGINFTGFFGLAGGDSTATMYLHDVVNDEWYEFDVVSQGPALGFTVNNVLNAETSTSINLEGIIYGTNGLTLTGTDLTFSNDNSNYSASVPLSNGVTRYRRTVTSNADNDQLDTFTITINDGTTDFSSDVAVITKSDSLIDVVDLPDFNILTQTMSDGSWTTNPNAPMSVENLLAGSGANGVKKYHDVIRFVKHVKARTLTVTNITSVTNGVANIEFTGKYISVTPSSTADTTMDITVTDDNSNTVSFTYTVENS